MNEIFHEVDLEIFQRVAEEHAGISFRAILDLVLNGDFAGIGKLFLAYMEGMFMESFGDTAVSVMELVLFVIISSVFSLFASSVAEKGINETVRLILYFMFFSGAVLLLKDYISKAAEAILQFVEIVQILFPAWMITLSSLSGIMTMQATYAIGYFVIMVMEKGIGKIFPILIYSFALTRFTGNIQKENFLTSMSNLIQSGYENLLKGVLFCVTGIQFFQNLFLPFLDGFSKNAAGKILSGLPGLGQGVESTIHMTYSALVLIKNSIGAAMIVLLLLIAIEPILKFFFYFVMFRVTTAILQPIAEPQMLRGLETVSDSLLLILKTILMVTFLFLIMISLICSAGNISYYAV